MVWFPLRVGQLKTTATILLWISISNGNTKPIGGFKPPIKPWAAKQMDFQQKNVHYLQ
jgi:hypothetical protein